jgi:fumarate hydratase subunit beta
MKLTPPLTDEDVLKLRAGDQVTITGVIYTGRDAAHKRLIEALDKGETLPFDPRGQVIYYMGPSPTPPGRVIGSAGPTTAGRMDAYTPRLLEAGLKGMIGKGSRSKNVRDAIVAHKAVYIAATGGVAALISQCIEKAETIAYPELGAEALLRLQVGNFPAIVVNDIYGGDAYEDGKKQYRRDATASPAT